MARLRPWALVLLACVVACATPAPPAPDASAKVEAPGPRFAAGGPAADELGAAEGYPKGSRATFYSVWNAVGSHSHMDEIFPSRLVHKAAGALAPRAGRRAAHPERRWTTTWRGA